MAHRSLSRLLLTAFGVSLLAGAGQLGLAFGFGIVRLTGAFNGATVNQWPAQLVWVGWFAANAAVIGAVLTERVARQERQLVGTGRQLAVAGSAALGATVVAPLCMQPARDAELISVDPVWAVAICAVLGAVVGAGAALAVLVRPPFAWNMAAVAGAMWLIALLSVVPSLGASGPLTPVRLGVLEPAWLSAGTAQQLALLILPITALLAGLAGAAVARWRGHPPLTSGPSGVAGPVLVAFAYLAAGPGHSADRYQLAPYYGALIAIAVGALGSTAAALLPWPLTGHPGPATQAIEPTAILQPLPATPALPAPPSRPAGQHSVPADTPPHWQWPDQQTGSLATAAGTAALLPGTPAPSAPGLSTPTLPEGSPAGAPPAGAPGPSAPAQHDEDTTPNPAATLPGSPAAQAPVEDAPAPSDSSAPAVGAALAGPSRVDAHAPAEGSAVTGGAEPAVDPAPVGDGSDIPSAARPTGSPLAPTSASTPAPTSTSASAPAPGPAGKAPTPRRTRKPRTSTAAASSAPQPEARQAADPHEASPISHEASSTAHDTDAARQGADTNPQADAATSVAEHVGPPRSPFAGPNVGTGGDVDAPWPTVDAASGSTEVRPEPAPRPRHRLTLPELNSAAPWDAFAPAADPQPVDDATTGTAREPLAADGPAIADPSASPAAPAAPGGTEPTGPASPSPSGRDPLSPDGLDAARPDGLDPVSTARELSAAFAATPAVSTDPAAVARDLSAAFTKPPAVAPEDVQPGGERDKGLRGLFRRGKSRPDNAADGEEPLPAQDEEYVDWVAALGRPVADEPAPKKSRRSLRSTGRHHRD